ncbi:PP2C family protein-serine/threonine phosphatase [Aromatoleum sp.]|uniref:PP2C family protein-serine/threonine phosphatase n=1 Tax=Aromatoleum sp. TaxID=2307007 RepID=UPI002FCA429F
MTPVPHARRPAIECCARTDVGRVRARNEDALAVRAERGWAVLADGMGGYRGGDVASRVAVGAVLQRLEREAAAGRLEDVDGVREALAGAARGANDAILVEARAQPKLAGMGSTLVAAVFLPGRVVSANVGDSRLYRLRAGLFEQLTRDHTMLQEQIDGGILSAADAARMEFKGMLTRGLGVLPEVEPDVGVHVARAGDLFLLCSDGLTDMVRDDDIAVALDPAGPLSASAERLVERANLNGGRDNISVVLVRMSG